MVLFFMLLMLTCLQYAVSQWQPWPAPPHWVFKTQMARYLIHYGNWGAVASVSPEFALMPFATVQSYADGVFNNSSGIPYFYISDMSDTYNNMKHNNSAALTVSLAESQHCQQQNLDPEEPPCARVTVFGQLLAVTEPSEIQFARTALFTRHPVMKQWPTSHDWQFYKLNISQIMIVDFYGPGTRIDVDKYFHTKP